MTQSQRRLAFVAACLVTILGLGFLVANQTGSGAGTSGSGAGAAEAGGAGGASAGAAPLSTPVLSARRVPELLASHTVDQNVRSALAPLLARALPDSCIVVSKGGRVVFDQRGSVAMAPASVQKLLVADALLETFGPDHRLETTVVSGQEPEAGVVEGDLYLVGGGDPLLTTDGYQRTLENPQQLSNPFAQLADRIVAAGIREVRGGVVGDESRYDTVRTMAGWPDRYLFEGHVGPLGALIVNDGSTGFTANPDEGESHRVPGDPASLASETLVTLLERRGVKVTGGASVGRAPEGAHQVASLPSLPMSGLVAELIGDSDNTTAELLVKELGVHHSGRGTTADGLAALTEVLRASGLPTEGLKLVDGSGLDMGNRLTCDTLVAVLDEHGPQSAIGRSLAIAGETGTLRRRMRNTPAAGRVHAKTGTLNTVNALAGFADTAADGDLTFAYVVNGESQPEGYAPLDELATALVGVAGGPPVAQLGPLGGNG